ncbi:MAG TPA: hypothetical protein VIP55_06745 [Agromyces sp.]|uniref:hypothetical protein n=1 Tax=Microbacterium sp. TaxID=51671 RepID=UPI002F942BE0
MSYLSRTEAKDMARAVHAVGRLFDDCQVSRITLPCHIPLEAHEGFFVWKVDEWAFGAYRCQRHWWGVGLQPHHLVRLRSPCPENARAELEGVPRADLGPMTTSPEALAIRLYLQRRSLA